MRPSDPLLHEEPRCTRASRSRHCTELDRPLAARVRHHLGRSITTPSPNHVQGFAPLPPDGAAMARATALLPALCRSAAHLGFLSRIVRPLHRPTKMRPGRAPGTRAPPRRTSARKSQRRRRGIAQGCRTYLRGIASAPSTCRSPTQKCSSRKKHTHARTSTHIRANLHGVHR